MMPAIPHEVDQAARPRIADRQPALQKETPPRRLQHDLDGAFEEGSSAPRLRLAEELFCSGAGVPRPRGCPGPEPSSLDLRSVRSCRSNVGAATSLHELHNLADLAVGHQRAWLG